MHMETVWLSFPLSSSKSTLSLLVFKIQKDQWPRQQPRLLMKVFTGESKSGLISQSHNCGGWTQWVRSAVNRKKHWLSSSALTPHPSLVLLLCLHARRGVHSVESLDWNRSSVSDKNRKKWHMWNHIPSPRDCNDQLEAKNVKITPLLTYVKKLMKVF